MGETVWVVLYYRDTNPDPLTSPSEVAGVYRQVPDALERATAIVKARGGSAFCGSIIVDAFLPAGPIEWPGATYWVSHNGGLTETVELLNGQPYVEVNGV